MGIDKKPEGNFDSAIFDLDGVLVDTAKYHYLAWKRLAGELGFEFTRMQNERLKGVSRMRSLELLLEIGGMDLSDEEKLWMCEKKNRYYVDYISKLDKSEILPGARENLVALKQYGIKVALGSASKNARMIIEKLGIAGLFQSVVDGNMVSKTKPDPEVFLIAARGLGSAPGSCAVFEDSGAGIRAAKAAGMYAVGIGHESVLEEADMVIKGLCDFDPGSLFKLKTAPKIAEEC